METDTENFFIEPTGELEKLSEREKTVVSDSLMDFLKGNRKKFNEAHLHFRLKQHKEQFREKPLMYCNITFSTDRGNFNSAAEGWGAPNAVRNALKKLELQVEKKFGKMESKETIRDKTVAEVME